MREISCVAHSRLTARREVARRPMKPLGSGAPLAEGLDVITHRARSDVVDLYDAWSDLRGCRVAVKALRHDRLHDRAARAALLREGRLLARLHPSAPRARVRGTRGPAPARRARDPARRDAGRAARGPPAQHGGGRRSRAAGRQRAALHQRRGARPPRRQAVERGRRRRRREADRPLDRPAARPRRARAGVSWATCRRSRRAASSPGRPPTSGAWARFCTRRSPARRRSTTGTTRAPSPASITAPTRSGATGRARRARSPRWSTPRSSRTRWTALRSRSCSPSSTPTPASRRIGPLGGRRG